VTSHHLPPDAKINIYNQTPLAMPVVVIGEHGTKVEVTMHPGSTVTVTTGLEAVDITLEQNDNQVPGLQLVRDNTK